MAVLLVAAHPGGAAMAQTTPSSHAPGSAAAPDGSLADDVAQLRAKVLTLEAALRSTQSAVAGGMSGGTGGGGMGMGMGMDMPMGSPVGMGGPGGAPMSMMKMDDEMGGSGGMASMSGGGGMGAMMDMDDMMGMSPAGAVTGGMSMPTALPGFAGASHLYHIGSTSFFLDHSAHIVLSVPQQSSLNAIKEKTLLDRAAAQRQIDAAEQELWSLTASDQPDIAAIQAKIADIEKSRGEQRVAFIRAVGEAAKLLTDAQRQSLLGLQPPQTQIGQPAPAAPVAPAGGMPAMPGGGGGMSDM